MIPCRKVPIRLSKNHMSTWLNKLCSFPYLSINHFPTYLKLMVSFTKTIWIFFSLINFHVSACIMSLQLQFLSSSLKKYWLIYYPSANSVLQQNLPPELPASPSFCCWHLDLVTLLAQGILACCNYCCQKDDRNTSPMTEPC